LEPGETHQYDNRSSCLQQTMSCAPFRRFESCGARARDHQEAVSVVSVCQRNPRSRRCRGKTAHAGHDLKWNLCSAKHRNLLSSASEDKRIAAFEPAHDVSFASVLDHEVMNVGLLLILVSEAFACIDHNRVGARLGKNFRMD
jgi:hypothetical protein